MQPFELQLSGFDPCQSDQINQFSLIRWITMKYKYLIRYVARVAGLNNMVHIKGLN